MSASPAPFHGWATSIGHRGKGHLYYEGVPLCIDQTGKYYAAFTRATRPVVADDHLCAICCRRSERACLCPACRAKREGRA